MNTWNPRANDIFLDALDIHDAVARRRLLDEACRADAPLREQVDHLLAASENAGSFLGAPAASPFLGDRMTAAAKGSQIAAGLRIADHYTLLEEIGRGGMGVVYRAQDTALEREVAIKLLQDHFTADSPAARRFIAEARITGQLQHPGIPAIHEVGHISDGRPFLAMKLIDGRTLDELLKERTGDAHNWLAIFEAICQAVGYAHAHHVIHRDLKPANIMVGSFGEVQVMDWGLAKVLAAAAATPAADESTQFFLHRTEISTRDISDAALTQIGSVLGTPAYMSPEQAVGETDRIDQRSDVFSLGAILCVILTGQPPYTGKDSAAVRRAAMRGNLEDAFTRLDASGAEPGLIALAKSCLTFEPAARFAEASLVATEVAKLRADAEQRARHAEVQRAKAEVQSAEQRKRRRVQLALAACALSLLALFGGGLWWRESLASERETEKQVEAARNQQAIDAALDQAEAALRKENFDYREIDTALKQAEDRLVADQREEAHLRFAYLQKDRRMLVRVDEINNRRWDGSERARWTYKEYDIANYPIAFREYGIDIASELPAEAARKIANSTIKSALTGALYSWLSSDANPRLLTVINALDPDPHHISLCSAYLREDKSQIAQHVAKLDAGSLQPRFAQFVGAHRLTPYNQAIRILTTAQAAQPNDFGLTVQTAYRFYTFQRALKIPYLRCALALRPQNAGCSYELGLALMDQGDANGAMAAFQDAIRFDPTYADARCQIGNILAEKGDTAGAVANYKEAIKLAPNFSGAYDNYATFLYKQGKTVEAIALFKEGLRRDPPHVSLADRNLGNLLFAIKDYDGAIAAYQEGIRRGPRDDLYVGLGNALRAKKDYDGAIAAYKDALNNNIYS